MIKSRAKTEKPENKRKGNKRRRGTKSRSDTEDNKLTAWMKCRWYDL